VVGDPRQAIYRFRNCDLNTYLAARTLMLDKENAQRFDMNLNRRSGKKYIEQLNLILTAPTPLPCPMRI
jgi:ATP-dependent exoDNAse (exonuclease V) beta subunit